jgi:hypothetical protein
MRKDLDDSLTTEFPNLYRDRNDPNNRHGLRYGFACGNGWYPLISKTSAKLEKLILQLPENKRKFYKAVQVKQKFGCLRLYMHDRTPEMKNIIADAEEESLHTCEVCGRLGGIIQLPNRWVSVNCEEHKDVAHWRDMENFDIHWSVKLKNLLTFRW